MQQYLKSLSDILIHGEEREERTGTGEISLFGGQDIYDLRNGFPLVTTRKLNFDHIVNELLWFLSGSNNIIDLPEESRFMWSSWAREGNIGSLYGSQWRRFGDSHYNVDQITELIRNIKKDPYSRRHFVTAWNPVSIKRENNALVPCHVSFQVYCHTDGYMSLHMYQRSADFPIGVPTNIASYSLLLSMIAHVTGYKPKEFIHSYGDRHIYINQIEKVQKQINRRPLPLPELLLNPEIKKIDDFTIDDIQLFDYECHPGIRYPLAV